MPLTKPGVAGRVEEKYEALRLLLTVFELLSVPKSNLLSNDNGPIFIGSLDECVSLI